jgi:hypothetical protein
MHLCGIAAEDRSGAQNAHRLILAVLAVSNPGLPDFLEVELAKGFEPPTL